MRFDGRSYVISPLRYSCRQRMVVRFATQVMPLLTRLVCSHRLNTWLWRRLGCQIGFRSIIRMGTAINVPFKGSIGADCLIHGHLKSRGGIRIGDGVELVEDVLISTQSHNVDSQYFEAEYSPVVVENFVWIGPRAIILPKVKLAVGSIIAAGAVVTHDSEPWGVYAGVPAKRIKWRTVLRSVDADESS